MKKQLIQFDEIKFNSEISSLEDAANEMNAVIQVYNSLGFGSYTKEDFPGLFFNTENFIYEKIMKDQPAEMMGMKIDKRKFFNEFLVKPKGYYDMIASLDSLKKKVDVKLKWRKDIKDFKSYLNLFSQTPNGEFKVKEEEINSRREKHETYITTERGILSYKLALAINEFLQNEGNMKLNIHNRRSLEEFAGNAINFTNGSTEVKTSYITFCDK